MSMAEMSGGQSAEKDATRIVRQVVVSGMVEEPADD